MSTLADRLRDVIRPGALPSARRGGTSVPPSEAVEEGGTQGGGTKVPPLRARGADAADVLGGEWRVAGSHQFLVVNRKYSPGYRHGHMAVADASPSSDGLWPTLSLLAGVPCDGRAVFVDLETTGLAGGAGTYAFLVGCGWFDAGTFRVQQFLLSSFAAERALLDAVAEVADAAGTVITYNGKTFDLPLMETRFILHRKETPFAGMPHVDMLHPARRLWRGDEESCRLSVLEQSLCGHVREGDVPGFEIPARYFHYVRSGDARPLEAVLEHNRLDLLSLAFLTSRAAMLLEEGPSAVRAAREAIGLGRLYERGGLLPEAQRCFVRAAEFPADGPTTVEALRACAVVLRRLRRFAEAADYWRKVVDVRDAPESMVREATEALAVHHEHRLRDLQTARALALRSLDCQGTAARTHALQHRLARLTRKIGDERQSAALF
jgi:uncharacterized protein